MAFMLALIPSIIPSNYEESQQYKCLIALKQKRSVIFKYYYYHDSLLVKGWQWCAELLTTTNDSNIKNMFYSILMVESVTWVAKED